MCGRLVEEAKILRRCIPWLRRMERGESVVVNLRLDTDTETEYVPFDRARVMHIWDASPPICTTWLEGGVVPSKGQDDPLAIGASWPNQHSNRRNYPHARNKML